MDTNWFIVIFDVFEALKNFGTWINGFISLHIELPKFLSVPLGVDYLTPLQICGGVGLSIIVVAIFIKNVVPVA